MGPCRKDKAWLFHNNEAEWSGENGGVADWDYGEAGAGTAVLSEDV